MAEPQSIQDLINLGYGGYRGWNDQAAALQNFRETGGQGKYDVPSAQEYNQQKGISSPQVQPQVQPQPVQSFNDYVNQAQQMYQEAAKPAIASLEASKPEIISSVAGKTKLLNERYNNIINEIKTGQKSAETRQTTVTAGELGKRGIDPTSTLYGQELTNAINPITGEYSNLLKSTGTEQASGLQDLADLETTQLRNLANSIAQIQSGSSTGGIELALKQYQMAQQAAENATTLAEQRRQTDIANALQQKIYETISLPTSQANIASTQANIANLQSLTNQRGQTDTTKSVADTLKSLGVNFNPTNLGVGQGGWQ